MDVVRADGNRINDSVMELLIMISACKSGSAKSITGIESSRYLGRSTAEKPQLLSPTSLTLGNPKRNLTEAP